jgi:NAD(P)-dependent dehydrogenase (short-subunit alcohol dehydrogenase family)
VTGGNRGIGYAISEGLAEAGANVVVANRDGEAGEAAAEELAEETGVETLAVPTDVSEEEDVKNLMSETVEEFGSIDVLVNNAGVVLEGPALEKPADEFRKTIEINLTGAFLCAKHAAEEMVESGGGNIVNISSMSAFVANYPQTHTDYQASKAGMEGMKNQLASEWADHDIRINNINPGYIATDIIDNLLDENPDLEATWLDGMLQDELAPPEDIAPLAVFLASDASAYMTGESVVIDGGYTVR